MAYRSGRVIGRASLRSAGDELALSVWPDRTDVRIDGTDLAYVDIALTDHDGVVHVDRDRPVTVGIEGPARLQGLGTSDPSPDRPFVSATCPTHDDRALAAIRPTGPGPIAVTITAPDCHP